MRPAAALVLPMTLLLTVPLARAAGPRAGSPLGLVALTAPAVLIATAALAQEPEAEQTMTAPPPGLSLTGRWVLDAGRSDDAEREAREATKGAQTDPRPRYPPIYPGQPVYPGEWERRPPPTGPGIDVTTPGMTAPVTDDPFRRGGGSAGSGSSRSQLGLPLDHLRDLPETLTIAQRPSMILIQENDDEGRTRALVPDGVRHLSADRESETLTRWEGTRLHVETWHDDGVHVEVIFEIAPDRSFLTVTVKADDGGDALSVERVFTPDTPSS